MKKLNEVKVGDTLYCIAYSTDGKDSVKVVPLTAKEVITDGPDVKRHIYSKEAIVLKEKVPNSPEAEGEYVIDQYYRSDECASGSCDIYTTYEEARRRAINELESHYKYNATEIEQLQQQQANIIQSLTTLALNTEPEH